MKKGLQYPIDLTSDDTVHFLLIKIFQGESEGVQSIDRQIQDAEYVRAGIAQASAQYSESEGTDETTIDIPGLQSAVFGNQENYQIGEDANGRPVYITRSSITGNMNDLEVTESIDVSTDEGTTVQMERNISYDQYIESLRERRQNTETTNRQSVNAVENMKSGFGRATQRRATERMEETIALYLPHKLNVAGFNTYDTPDFEVIKNVQNLLAGNVSSVMSTLIRRGAGMLDNLGQIAGTEINAERAIAAMTGRVINPRRETLYQSPEMRKFEFAFEFTPRNYDESVMIHDIIRTLKHHAYPTKGSGGVFLNMPAEFLLEYYMIDENGTARENLWLNRIGRCVLQEINVDYTGAGSVAMFRNGAPTHVNMTLSFQEIELITQEAVDLGY